MILYIGNKLSKYGFTPTSIETLGIKLAQHYPVRLVSDKKNKIARFFDFIFSIIKGRKSIKLIIIDTYSTSNFYFAFASALLANIFRIHYVPILRGGNLPHRLKTSPRMSSMIFKNSFKNIAPSMYLYQDFEKLGFPVDYIPNNIEMKIYHFKKRVQVTPRMLYVRSMQKLYNPQMAVRVLDLLAKKYDDAFLCMVGPDKDGSLEETKKLAEDLGLSDKVKFTGALSKPDWIKLSVDYDIFINTTNFDNHPVSVIEAMALGLPVVTTNVGGVPFLVDDEENGLLVPPNQVDEFVKAVERLIETPELAERIAKNARQKVEAYDWETVKFQWFELIDDAIQ